jgi:hypothetical protein
VIARRETNLGLAVILIVIRLREDFVFPGGKAVKVDLTFFVGVSPVGGSRKDYLDSLGVCLPLEEKDPRKRSVFRGRGGAQAPYPEQNRSGADKV